MKQRFENNMAVPMESFEYASVTYVQIRGKRSQFSVIHFLCLNQICQTFQENSQCLSSYGFLIGTSDGGRSILGCTHCSTEQVGREADAVKLYLPGGLHIIGLYFKAKDKERDEDVLDSLQKYSPEQLFRNGQYLVLVLHGSKKPDQVFVHDFDQGYTPADLQPNDLDLLSKHAVVRTKCCFNISLKSGEKSDSWHSSLDSQITDICDRVNSDCAMLHVNNSNVLLKSDRTCGLSEDSVINDVYENVDCDNDFIQTRSHKKSKLNQATLQTTLYLQTTGDISTKNSPDCAPVIQHKFEKFRNVQTTLEVDSLSLIPHKSPVQGLLPLVKTAICNQVQNMGKCIIRSTQKNTFFAPQPHHFVPSNTFLCTVVYPKGVEENKLESWRKELHKLFCQSVDVPLFRRGNRVLLHEDKANHPYLINPHIGLSTNTVKDGRQYLVHGLYSYHHYMQDRFDDNKWGCAYRSLQTLVSWFRFQGYTDKPVPTHPEIQKALVDVGDKEPKFVGSRQWIGSMEVSYCLDHLIGVTSKIIFVNAGSEMGTKGRELAVHFQTQGTPIMIGGGVLAHTILGVDFNDVTGDIKFLILDPHYTGVEDLSVIQDKGWCGWKSLDFWEKTAHYNMCLPQRPKML
ncbi:hypothetical protein FSP39_024353 [Pinctada imbricata]|uniref:Ufm1-specific protease 2 n=1 Tax=Pinctada imbricata TaxID=66713 RepID=A0AA89BY08_PINIB|nr:hypothetical protein FSP39_024353 [Pinctada imbricata]